MGMKEQQRSVYRSMQGREVDMNRLVNQNELTVAVGNIKVNARGDELGPGGKIVKKREDVIREMNSKLVPDQSASPQRSAIEEPTIKTPIAKEEKKFSKPITKNLTEEDPE